MKELHIGLDLGIKYESEYSFYGRCKLTGLVVGAEKWNRSDYNCRGFSCKLIV